MEKDGTGREIKEVKEGTILPARYFSAVFDWGIGGVLDENGEYVEESGMEVMHRFGGKYDFDEQECEYLDETVIYIGPMMTHWGHFLAECSVRFWYLLENQEDYRAAFCGFWYGEGELSSKLIDIFGLLGVGKERMLDIRRPVKCKRILIPSPALTYASCELASGTIENFFANWGKYNRSWSYTAAFRKTFQNIEIVGFIDNDLARHNGVFHGITIYSPLDIAKIDFDYIDLWVADWREEIEMQIAAMGIDEGKLESVFNDYMKKMIDKYSDTLDKEIQSFLHMMEQKKEPCVYAYNPVRQYDMKEVIYDENKDLYYTWFEGKKLYLASHYKFTVKNGKKYVKDFWGEQDLNSPHRYEEADVRVEEGDVLVDAGVCEGNFSLHNVDKASKIYLIECDPNWMKALRATFEPYKDKIVFCNKFLGGCDTETMITLNSLVKEPVNFVKMDIEGEEINALRGSDRVFAGSNNIKCSICSYHRHGDEEKIKAILQEYGLKTVVSKGYMLFTYDAEIWRNPELRRGVVRGRKV